MRLGGGREGLVLGQEVGMVAIRSLVVACVVFVGPQVDISDGLVDEGDDIIDLLLQLRGVLNEYLLLLMVLEVWLELRVAGN
jgi:hypothetical protein